jgi:O-antigen/teichoic acid export membrane protein
MTASFGQKMARGATWMLLFKFVDRGLSFVSTIVLARVLVPADFGLVAMAMSVIALIELASAFSLEVGLIQRKDPSRAHYDTTWTLRLALTLLCALLTAALALPAASFYADPRLAPIMWVLAAGWLIEGLENIATVDFRRELNFRREFVFLAVKRVLAVAVTLGAALWFRSYWALIAGTLAGRVVGLALSYAMLAYRPRFCLRAWRDVMGFSVWLFISNVLVFINSRVSHFVIGRTHGAGPLGLYTMAADLAALASSEITMPINRAVLPGLSRMAENEDGMRGGLVRVIAAVALLALPASFGLAAIAEPLVLTLLGARWIDAVPVVQVLAFAGALQAITATNQSAYLASGRSFVPVITQSTLAAVLVALLVAFAGRGVIGIAIAQLCATIAAVGVSVALMRRFLAVRATALLGAVARPLIAGALMAILVFALDRARFGLGADLAAPLRLVFGLIAGAASYALLVLALWIAAGRPDSIERQLLVRLRRLRVAAP